MGIFRPVKSTADHCRFAPFRKAVGSGVLKHLGRFGPLGQSTPGLVNSNKNTFCRETSTHPAPICPDDSRWAEKLGRLLVRASGKMLRAI
jgi:hypothetical protein